MLPLIELLLIVISQKMIDYATTLNTKGERYPNMIRIAHILFHKSLDAGVSTSVEYFVIFNVTAPSV